MSDLTRRPQWDVPAVPEEPAPPPLARDPEFGRFDMRQYYLLLLRRKWLIVAVMLTVVAAATFQVYTTTPLYTAVARLQIDPENPNLLPYQDPFQSPFYLLAAEAYIRTQAEILRSRSLAKRLVVSLDLAEDPVFNARVRSGFFTELLGSVSQAVRELLRWTPARPAAAGIDGAAREEALADAFRGAIGVNPIRGTRLLELSYTSHDPDFAARVVNELTRQYLELTFERKVKTTTVAGQFLEENLQDLKKKLEDSEQEMLAYARRNDIIDIDENSQDIVVQRLTALTSELTAAEARVIGASASLDSVRDGGLENFPQRFKSPEILDLEANQADLEQELARLSVSYGPDWPAVRQKSREVETVQKQLERAKRNALEKIREEYQTALSLRDRLRAALEEEKNRANRLFAASIQYNILNREAESNKEMYQSLLQRSKQAEVSASLRSSNIQVIDDARAPHFASSPNKRQAIMLGLFMGLILGIGLAFVMEYVDSSVKTPDDLMEHTGLPTLSVIPRLEQVRPAARSREGENGSAGALVRYMDFPKSHMWEAYRALRTSILLSHSGGPPRSLLVTSALPGEGKTTTALHTAMVLAQTGKRTVLIDLDLRKPTIARRIGLDGTRGMTNYLSGNSRLASQLQPSGVPNLFVLPSGPHPPNPAELIGSPRMKSTLELLREYVDFVVLDSPPILSVSDALILANIVDGVVLVVQGGRTPREAVRKASDRLHSVGGQILGALINNVDVRKTEYSYYYRYYYYYDDYYTDPAGGARQAAES